MMFAAAAWIASLLLVSAQATDSDAKIDRFVDLAKNGAPAVRPQAADRLSRMGSTVADRLLVECGESPAEMASLGPELVEILARFEDERLRTKLWAATGDRDFPWRPAASRSLALAPRLDEHARFETLGHDQLAAVRVAAIEGWRLDWPDSEAHFTASLSDPDDRVRRAAVGRLHGMGAAWALAWPLEELRRTDRFFEIDTGRIARFEASRLLRGALGDLDGYAPQLPPDDPVNLNALEILHRRVSALYEGPAPELPRIARAASAVPAGQFGLELRSCRAGELYLQWGPGDTLWVGLGNPRRIALASGTLAKLDALAKTAIEASGERRVFGTPGCDVECLRLGVSAGDQQTFYLRKGSEPVPGLRPASLAPLVMAFVAGLPPAEEALRLRLARALAAVGGPLDR